MENIVKQTSLLEKTGVFDEEGKCRFELTLNYKGMKGKKILVIGMNPASNNIQVFDSTTNYLLNNLGIMGYSEVTVWNLFANICTKLKPAEIKDNSKNMQYLEELLKRRAMDYLCQYISIRYSQFVTSKSNTSENVIVPNDCKGRIQYLKAKLLPNGRRATVEVFLPEIVFEEIMQLGGFTDKKVVLKRLKEEGYLHAESDRYLSNITIAVPPKVKGYRIYIPAEQEKKIERRDDSTRKNDEGGK